MTELKSPQRPPAAPIPEEELVPADDAVIGRAFRWSLLVLVALVAIVGVTLWWINREPAVVENVVDKDPGAMQGLQTDAETIAALRFTRINDEAGIDFTHVSGARGQKLLPETMGAGAAFFDLEPDGDQDLLLINSAWWPWDGVPGPAPTMALYANDGTGSFENVTAVWGLDTSLYGTGVACGDYDNDGKVDLYITAVGGNRLFRHTGSAYEDVTESAGVGGGDEQWSTSSGFFDADNDGDLDLWVCNYIEWSREIDLELNYTLNGVDRAYGPPTNFRGAHCQLYRNEGDGSFIDVSEAAGLHVLNPATGMPVGKSLAVVFLDIEDDGDLDVLVANDTTQNFLFENSGDGTFEEIGALSGVAFDGMGQSTGAMGIDAAHYRNDDDLAVAIGNFANEMTSFYVRQGTAGQFSDDAVIEGVGSPTRVALSFGLFFFDCDLDGRLDMLQANGHLEEEINELQSSQHYRQPAQLFWNRGRDAGGATYVEVPRERTGDLGTPIVGRGATYADIDADGDLDVLLTESGGAPLLLRNDQNLDHHWLRLRLVGRTCNRDAIGARVELVAGGRKQIRQVSPTRSYLCQVELPVTFGLGGADAVESLRIFWPDGTEHEVTVAGVDRMIVVEQPKEAEGHALAPQP